MSVRWLPYSTRSKANDDRDRRVYGRISAGPYVVTLPQGVNVRMDGITVDDVALTPSRLQFPALMEMIAPRRSAAADTSRKHAKGIMGNLASFYEGIRVGNFEMNGLSVETPQGPLKLQAMRFNFADGKVGEIAIEGLDGRAPNGPVKLGRFAMKVPRRRQLHAGGGAVAVEQAFG